MNQSKSSSLAALTLLAVLAASFLVTGCACCRPAEPLPDGDPPPTGFLFRTNYHGWEDSIWLGNGQVEAIIVPAIGRVMQFRFAGEEEGPFWENEALFGKPPNPASTTWLNFGGDKTWPAPQSHWGDYQPTNWPPPPGFDATPVEAHVDGWVVTLVYPIDPHTGVRVTRLVELGVDQPSMRITTSYEKLQGTTLETGIWIITQLKEPLAVYARVPAHSIFPQSFQPMTGKRPPSLQLRNRMLSLQRDPKESHKIGLDIGSLLWMGEDYVLKIDAPRIPYRTYPDDGCSAQIYTNPDPLPYVELEALNPIHQLQIGRAHV